MQGLPVHGEASQCLGLPEEGLDVQWVELVAAPAWGGGGVRGSWGELGGGEGG